MTNLDELLLYEDNHLIAFNKPAGLLVQGDQTRDKPLVELCKEYLKIKYSKPGNVFSGVIHRLDRPTSGCIVLAKTSKALSRMTRMFAERKVDKKYLAISSRSKYANSGTLINFIEKLDSKNKVVCYQRPKKNAKRAELDYEVLEHFGNTSLIKVLLKTGRKHQIRSQLSKIGANIVGDLKYGYEFPNQDKSICLHCSSLEFNHPVTKDSIRLECMPPFIPEWQDANQWIESNGNKNIIL